MLLKAKDYSIVRSHMKLRDAFIYTPNGTLLEITEEPHVKDGHVVYQCGDTTHRYSLNSTAPIFVAVEPDLYVFDSELMVKVKPYSKLMHHFWAYQQFSVNPKKFIGYFKNTYPTDSRALVSNFKGLVLRHGEWFHWDLPGDLYIDRLSLVEILEEGERLLGSASRLLENAPKVRTYNTEEIINTPNGPGRVELVYDDYSVLVRLVGGGARVTYYLETFSLEELDGMN